MEYNFGDVAMVWPMPCGPIPDGNLWIGTHFVSQKLGLAEIAWDTTTQKTPVNFLKDHQIYIVNMFDGQTHVSEIRKVRPDAHIVALPDSYFELSFLNANRTSYLKELEMADRLAYVNTYDYLFYETIPFKRKLPFWQFTVPVGDLHNFVNYRQVAKMMKPENRLAWDQSFCLTLDHGGRERPYLTAQNLIVAAFLQKTYNLDIVYCNAQPQTKELANEMGLEVHFIDYMLYTEFARMSGLATIGIDLYALHGYGRNEVTWSLMGLPYVAGSYTTAVSAWPKYDPFNVSQAIAEAKRIMENRAYTDHNIEIAFNLHAKMSNIQEFYERLDIYLREMTNGGS